MKSKDIVFSLFFSLFIGNILFCTEVFAQSNTGINTTTRTKPKSEIAPPESDAQVKKFDKERWNKLKEDIHYTKEQKEKNNAELPKIGRVDWSFLAGLKYAVVGIVVALLALALVWFLTKGILFGKKTTKHEEEQVAFLTEENLEKVKFGYLREALEKALLHKNYRTAIRIQYLWLLKVLYEKELIDWKKDKTNHAYISELASRSDIKDSGLFKKLTLWYEKAWYGERLVSAEDYQSVEKFFIDFRSYYEQEVA